MDRKVDQTEPTRLPTPNLFRGKLFSSTLFDETFVNIYELLDAQIQQRRITIDGLRLVGNTLKNQEMQCAKAKVGGSVIGVIGGGMAIVGLSISLSGIGAIVGAPLGIVGASLAAAGGLTTGITVVVENILKKIGIGQIQADLIKDNFRAEQIRVLLGRSAADPNFAERWKIDHMEAVSFVSMLPRLTKVGLTTAAGVRAAMGITAGIGRGAATTGLHVAGIVFAAALIPLDLTQMIISSIKIHKNESSVIVKEILELAEQLETELKLFLLNGNHFHLMTCSNSENQPHWVYLAVYARCLNSFLLEKEHRHFRYEDVIKLGEVIEQGKGSAVPESILKKIQTEWHDKQLAYMITAAENLNTEE